MSSDAVLSSELKLLQEELATSRKERAAPSAAAPSPVQPNSEPPGPAGAPEETPDERELKGQLQALADEVTNFLAEAEKGIAAHPTQSVVGALVVGIMIGWLLGRR